MILIVDSKVNRVNVDFGINIGRFRFIQAMHVLNVHNVVLGIKVFYDNSPIVHIREGGVLYMYKPWTLDYSWAWRPKLLLTSTVKMDFYILVWFLKKCIRKKTYLEMLKRQKQKRAMAKKDFIFSCSCCCKSKNWMICRQKTSSSYKNFLLHHWK